MRRRWWFLGSLAATAAAGAWMESIAPGRILELELGFTAANAADILAAWARDPGLDQGVAYLLRDYAFLAVYWVPMTIAVDWAAERLAARGLDAAAAAARAVRWLPISAAALDVVEDGFLLLLADDARDGAITSGWAAPAASTAAAAKWLLVLAVFGYVARALAARRATAPDAAG